jgi:hypothetical protein
MTMRGDGIPNEARQDQDLGRGKQDVLYDTTGGNRTPLGERFGNARERQPDSDFRADANQIATVREDSGMRFVPTAVHGAVDYPMAILTMASPWLFGFRKGGMETWVPVAVGGMCLLTNAMTKHEVSVSKVVPMRMHAMLDVMNGAMLAASPWLFGFSGRTMLPHLMLGTLEVISGLTVKTKPSLQYRQSH